MTINSLQSSTAPKIHSSRTRFAGGLNSGAGRFLMRGIKRVRLSPMQRAILSFPGSDGLVSLRHMLDHLWDRFPKTSREAFITEVGKSLFKLRRLGDLYLERQYGTERGPTTTAVAT